MERNMLSSSSRRRAQRKTAQAAVDAATESSERVTARAKSISQTIVDQDKAHGRESLPFNAAFDEEDSLVTSVEQVIATSNEQCATSSEISSERQIKK